MKTQNHSQTIPKEIKQKICEIQNDNIHGASYLAQQTATIFLHLIKQSNTYPFSKQKKILFQTAQDIIHAQPAMASIFSLTNKLLLQAEKAMDSENFIKIIHSTCNNFLSHLTKTSQQLTKHAQEIIFEKSTILTYSYSSAVYNTLIAAKKKGIAFKVICPESRPLNEGATLAQKLADQKIHTTLIIDSAIFSHIPKIDLILIGADAVTTKGIVNKIGSNGIALAAQNSNKPFYPLFTTDKLLPNQYEPHIEIEKNPEEIKPTNSKLHILNYYFDFTPFTFFSNMITEQGIQKTEQIQKIINSIEFHPFLKNLGSP